LERNENDGEADENLGGAQGDSDSDFEVKVKGSRANKMSRVSAANLIASSSILISHSRSLSIRSNEISSRKSSRY
jgi:hypothetical protein